MKKYFIHNGKESSGPFDIEELKYKNTTKSTPIWFEGLQDWKTAGEIAELNSLFKAIPPPIKPLTKATKEYKAIPHKTILGLSKNKFYIGFSVLVLVIFTIIFNVIDQNRSDELEAKNKKTEIENQQFILQQKQIEDQKRQLIEKDSIEKQRLTDGRKQSIQNRLVEIQKTIIEDKIVLEEAQNNLVKASDFKFLRSSIERKEEIISLQIQIDSLKNDIIKLEQERNELGLVQEHFQ